MEENLDERAYIRGQEAEQFLQSGGVYFTKLMEEIRIDLMKELISLSPSQRDEFSALKAVLDNLDEPINRVNADIQLGKNAWERMNGRIDQTKGIL